MNPDQRQRLARANLRMAHFTLKKRLPISINPDDVRAVVEAPQGVQIEMKSHPLETCYEVSESYEDVLSELDRAAM